MKKYLNITEVSELLNLKEHIIRYWDSVDPKTRKLRIDGISTKTNGGTRYFNKENIIKLEKIKNLLYKDGNQNYTLDLVNKILANRNLNNQINNISNYKPKFKINENAQKIKLILKNETFAK